jgi:hypothetical protein
MEFNYIADGIDAVVIDNFYSEEQLKEIMLELKWLTKPSVMVGEENLSSAKDEQSKEFLTSKSGIFLETVFLNWRHSALIKYPIDNFTKDIVRDKLLEFNPLFKMFYNIDSRTHLLSYYENSDFYKPHTDSTVFTVLNYFFNEPKKFTGGDIKLYGFNNKKEAEVDIRHNRVIIITGNTFHEVKQIKSNLDKSFSGDGRYCNAIFLNMRGDPPQKNKQNDSN